MSKRLRLRVVVDRNEFIPWLEEIGAEHLYGKQIKCELEVDDELAEHLSQEGVSILSGRHLESALVCQVVRKLAGSRPVPYTKTCVFNDPWPLADGGEWQEPEGGPWEDEFREGEHDEQTTEQWEEP